MDLPTIIADLLKAQDNYDSIAYANCFSETAVVFDENKTHRGRIEIGDWIDRANEKYKTVMKPISFQTKRMESILTSENSGTFPGSPIVLQYHFEIVNGLIQSLKVTE
jgi:hypothetical protein